MENSTINAAEMIVDLLGGLAIFLFGLDQLTDMVKATADARLRTT